MSIFLLWILFIWFGFGIVCIWNEDIVCTVDEMRFIAYSVPTIFCFVVYTAVALDFLDVLFGKKSFVKIGFDFAAINCYRTSQIALLVLYLKWVTYFESRVEGWLDGSMRNNYNYNYNTTTMKKTMGSLGICFNETLSAVESTTIQSGAALQNCSCHRIANLNSQTAVSWVTARIIFLMQDVRRKCCRKLKTD